jgi:hypothetical protein
VQALQQAVWTSFAHDYANALIYHEPTRDEIRRRADICNDFYCIARYEWGQGHEWTIDNLGHALRCKLEDTDIDVLKPTRPITIIE